MSGVGAMGVRADGTVLSIRVFGGIGIESSDGPLRLGGPRQRRLLALLVIRHGQTVTIDWLAEHLWTDEERPDAAATRLRTYLSRLRQALPERVAGWIETEPGGYCLTAPPDAVEHVRFARLRSLARAARESGDPLTARELLDDALALWRGEPFRELEDLDWARADIEQLHLDRLEMLEERWETELDLGVMLPCNVVVFVDEAGQTQVMAMDPVATMERLTKPGVTDVAREVRRLLAAALEKLP